MKATDIRAFRKRYGFTQQELADSVDMLATAVSDLERSRMPITMNRARKLKAFFSFVTKCAECGRL